MKLVVDRFEGDFAVLEMPDKTFVNVPKGILEGAKESDVISITVDQDETALRKREVESLMDELFRD
jgi:hypothetical protein